MYMMLGSKALEEARNANDDIEFFMLSKAAYNEVEVTLLGV